MIDPAGVFDEGFLRLGSADEADRTSDDGGRTGCAGFDEVQEMEQCGGCVSDRDNSALELGSLTGIYAGEAEGSI